MEVAVRPDHGADAHCEAGITGNRGAARIVEVSTQPSIGSSNRSKPICPTRGAMVSKSAVVSGDAQTNVLMPIAARITGAVFADAEVVQGIIPACR